MEKKIYYGKAQADFTEDEKELFQMDNTIILMMVMAEQNPMIKALNALRGGPAPEDELIIKRTIFVGKKFLGIPNPTSQEEYASLEAKAEESAYGLGKLMDDIGHDFEAWMAEQEGAETPEPHTEGEEKVEEPQG